MRIAAWKRVGEFSSNSAVFDLIRIQHMFAARATMEEEKQQQLLQHFMMDYCTAHGDTHFQSFQRFFAVEIAADIPLTDMINRIIRQQKWKQATVQH